MTVTTMCTWITRHGLLLYVILCFASRPTVLCNHTQGLLYI